MKIQQPAPQVGRLLEAFFSIVGDLGQLWTHFLIEYMVPGNNYWAIYTYQELNETTVKRFNMSRAVNKTITFKLTFDNDFNITLKEIENSIKKSLQVKATVTKSKKLAFITIDEEDLPKANITKTVY